LTLARSAYQPQQSVLKPHAGQRQTACIRYISAFPHRSQIIFSSSAPGRSLTIGRGRSGNGPSRGLVSDMLGIISSVIRRGTDRPSRIKVLHSVNKMTVCAVNVLIADASLR
jgi:hypothetical protein